MAKTKLTEELEFLVFQHYFLKKSERVALEVATIDKEKVDRLKKVDYNKRVDILSHKDGIFTAIEVKISKSDFKSKNGHNLVGQKNYYAVPPELADWVGDQVDKHVGVITYREKYKYKKVKGKRTRVPYNEMYVHKNAKKVKGYITNDKLKYYGGKHTIAEYQIHMMMTALNSTVNRLMKKMLGKD